MTEKNSKNVVSKAAPAQVIDPKYFAEQLFIIWDKVQNFDSFSEKISKNILTIQAIEAQVRNRKIESISIPWSLKGKKIKRSEKVWKTIENFDQFGNTFNQITKKIKESCGVYPKLIPFICPNGVDLEPHYQFACKWIDNNGLSKSKAEVLRLFVHLLPALLDHGGMRKVLRLHVRRANEIKKAIDTLNRYGIISDGTGLADRRLWGIIRNSIAVKTTQYAVDQRYLCFNPPLLRTIEFLGSINFRGRGQLLFELFDQYDLLKKLFPKLIGENKLTPIGKQKVIVTIGRDAHRLSKHTKWEIMNSYPMWKIYL